MRFKKSLQYPGARRTRAWHHHGSDTPTSARAVLHHTDQKGPNIMHPSVPKLVVKRSQGAALKQMLIPLSKLP